MAPKEGGTDGLEFVVLVFCLWGFSCVLECSVLCDRLTLGTVS